jgi:hypothetical protein
MAPLPDNPMTEILGALYAAPQQKQERQSFEDWLKTAKGGQRFVYCTRHALDAKTPPEVLEDAQLAKEAYARGEVELVQKRTNGKDSSNMSP